VAGLFWCEITLGYLWLNGFSRSRRAWSAIGR
jgi:hypothetical protein